MGIFPSVGEVLLLQTSCNMIHNWIGKLMHCNAKQIDTYPHIWRKKNIIITKWRFDWSKGDINIGKYACSLYFKFPLNYTYVKRRGLAKQEFTFMWCNKIDNLIHTKKLNKMCEFTEKGMSYIGLSTFYVP